MQGTGMLLAIEARDPANVTYRLDDQGSLAGDPVDRGTLSLDVRGTLALVSDNPPVDGCSDPRAPGIRFNDVVITELGFQASQSVESVCIDANLTTSWIRVAGP